MAETRSAAWAGWIIFAGTMLIVTGALNALEGIITLIWDERVVVTPAHFIVVDLTSWAWTILIFGLLLLGVGIALLTASTWARIVGIVLVGLHIVAQVVWLGAYPVWALLMIALDTVVLVALTFRWSEARASLRPDDDYQYDSPATRDASQPDVRVSPAS